MAWISEQGTQKQHACTWLAVLTVVHTYMRTPLPSAHLPLSTMTCCLTKILITPSLYFHNSQLVIIQQGDYDNPKNLSKSQQW